MNSPDRIKRASFAFYFILNLSLYKKLRSFLYYNDTINGIKILMMPDTTIFYLKR